MMKRRHLLGALPVLASPAYGAAALAHPALSAATTTDATAGIRAPQVQPMSAASVAQAFGGLQPSPRQPVLFIGHGSPMNILPGNVWHAGWQALGQRLMQLEAPPQLIVSISAHWLTQGGWQVTGMAQPRTIHDFGGFPPELYAMRYPAPGHPGAAAALADALGQTLAPEVGMLVDGEDWGLDHGTWSVLLPMFPQAQIPVLQLSIDYARPLAEHYRLGAELRRWRDHGVLVLGSGNIVHNLRRLQRDAPREQAWDWALEFDALVHQHIASGDVAQLAAFSPADPLMRLAHPSHDHYLPLLYAAAATHPGEQPQFFNQGFQHGAISMQSVMWSGAATSMSASAG